MRRLGFIGIVIDDRSVADDVNHLISEFGDYIIARTGIPYREKEVSVINLTVDIDTDTLGKLTGRLGNLPHVTIKSALCKS